MTVPGIHCLGKPIVVENATGGAGNIATGRVVKAAPDGYTLALAASTQIIMNPSLCRQNVEQHTARGCRKSARGRHEGARSR